eukprot:Sspe_Gene.20467::Locus_7522_Transcript_1_1_Confidence_1.000_Length_3286::g.20467::m.20467
MGACCSAQDHNLEVNEADDRLAVEELLQDAVGEGQGGAVELSIECHGLPDRDNFSKSDPFVAVWAYQEGDMANRQLLGRTETAANNLNPSFITPIMASFNRDEHQMLLFEVYHEKDPALGITDQTYLGEISIDMGKLLLQEGGQFRSKLTTNFAKVEGDEAFGFGMVAGKVTAVAAGTMHAASGVVQMMLTGNQKRQRDPDIYITAEFVQNVQEEVVLHIRGDHLERPRSRFGVKTAIANYFLQISRVQRNKIMPVARSNVSRQLLTKDTIQKGINPVWQPIRVKTYRLCCNNFDCPLLFQVFDYNFVDGGNHQVIGACRTTLAALRSGMVKKLQLLDENRLGDRRYENSGEVYIDQVKLLTSYSFLDYVKRGFEINCSLAVDFTSSNGGNVNDAESLHFVDPVDPIGNPNDYAQAIRSICKIVGRYDKDQMFPVLGFGAVLPTGKISHCFPTTLDTSQYEVQGEDAIVNSYYRCLHKVAMAEPTHLAPVIKWALRSARQNERMNPDQPSYQLLIIFTDGKIDDLTETVDVVVEASSAPMSILIIGIGKGDPETGFEHISTLEDPQLRSVITGKLQAREIVNFVSWNTCKGKDPTEFARAALAEVPKHFLSWVEMSGYSLDEVHDDDTFDGKSRHQDKDADSFDHSSRASLAHTRGSPKAAEPEQRTEPAFNVFEVHSLQSNTELNGLKGRAVGHKGDRIVLDLGPHGTCAVAAGNLRPVLPQELQKPPESRQESDEELKTSRGSLMLSKAVDEPSDSQVPYEPLEDDPKNPPPPTRRNPPPSTTPPVQPAGPLERSMSPRTTPPPPPAPLTPPARARQPRPTGTPEGTRTPQLTSQSDDRRASPPPSHNGSRRSSLDSPKGSRQAVNPYGPAVLARGGGRGKPVIDETATDTTERLTVLKMQAVEREDYDEAQAIKEKLSEIRKSRKVPTPASSLAPGAVVELHSLLHHAYLNGKRGRVVQLVPGQDAAIVEIGDHPGTEGGQCTVKLANLTVLPPGTVLHSLPKALPKALPPPSPPRVPRRERHRIDV